jgi:hypothetical protein
MQLGRRLALFRVQLLQGAALKVMRQVTGSQRHYFQPQLRKLSELMIVKAINAAKNQFHSVVRFGVANSRLRSVWDAGLVVCLVIIWTFRVIWASCPNRPFSRGAEDMQNELWRFSQDA